MSSEELPVAVSLPTPLQALVRWWPLAVVAAVLGGVIGFYAGRVGPVVYTAEARVAVGAGDLTSGAIAGFPLAAEQLASNYARYVNDQMVAGSSDVNVQATPIPSSNVIRIISGAPKADQATESANQVAQTLLKRVNASSADSSESVLKPYQQAVATYTDLQQRLDSWKARAAALEAQGGSSARLETAEANVRSLTEKVTIADARQQALSSKYQNTLTASSASKLIVVQKAVSAQSDRSSRLQRYSLLGVVSGSVVALVVASLIERLRRPRKRLRAA